MLAKTKSRARPITEIAMPPIARAIRILTRRLWSPPMSPSSMMNLNENGSAEAKAISQRRPSPTSMPRRQ
jgi:hypothetical protein